MRICLYAPSAPFSANVPRASDLFSSILYLFSVASRRVSSFHTSTPPAVQSRGHHPSCHTFSGSSNVRLRISFKFQPNFFFCASKQSQSRQQSSPSVQPNTIFFLCKQTIPEHSSRHEHHGAKVASWCIGMGQSITASMHHLI
jgi:zinc transporter ZupT